MHNMLNLEADGLQQQTTTTSPAPGIQEQKSEVAVGTGKNKVWSDESGLLLSHTEDRVRIRH